MVFQLRHNFKNVCLIASRLIGSVAIKNPILLIPWFKGIGDTFTPITAHPAEKMACL